MTTAIIERIETRLVDLPTIRPHKLSVATMHGQTLVLVKVYCSDGIVGMGGARPSRAWPMGPKAPSR
ncbi:Muconate cycloisomerase 1 [Paraburkholderia sediminicola]|uniref:Muconate cycloisomerase 1 n=1 Tax=Paraburkholderia sediminicola TaxID=458836 RepID=A0A6J5CUE8_9BURK|nr:hypothetical protein [Paraburkholderia sediminicola]CAB3745532.1 Muconate cycloisomerase 1 [Paraburkholderia sediminicola]